MSIFYPTRRNFRSHFLLPLPAHDHRLLPALRSPFEGQQYRQRRVDLQIVQEFRAKLKQTEDLISKLAFNLREIQGVWRKPKASANAPAQVTEFSMEIKESRSKSAKGHDRHR